MAGTTTELAEVLRELDDWGWRNEWAGWDPYDGLGATRLIGSRLRRSPLGRRLVLQAVKRSPINLRPLLGVAQATNSATLAWVLSAHARNGFLEPAESEARFERAARLLIDSRCPGYAEPCWGYHFDMASRAFFYPRGTPNAIATSFAAMALIDAYERSGDRRYLDLADGAASFMVREIPQTRDSPGAFFGYLPGDRSPIHNSNLHICALLARLAAHGADPAYRDAAAAGVRWSLERQRPDGSWPYGERPNLSWVDNFHTGYVLDSLQICADAGVGEETQAAVDRGLDYYRRHLILDDGTPKYYSTSVYPIDAQCVAQSIQTFAVGAARNPSWAEVAWRVLGFALSRMRHREWGFIFQRERLYRNRPPQPRAVQGPMLLAMTHLLCYEQQGSSDVRGYVRDSRPSA